LYSSVVKGTVEEQLDLLLAVYDTEPVEDPLTPQPPQLDARGISRDDFTRLVGTSHVDVACGFRGGLSRPSRETAVPLAADCRLFWCGCWHRPADGLCDTWQLPARARIMEVQQWPTIEFAVKSSDEHVTEAMSKTSISVPSGKLSYQQARDLLTSDAICTWGECFGHRFAQK
jgi:hypothetical protein